MLKQLICTTTILFFILPLYGMRESSAKRRTIESSPAIHFKYVANELRKTFIHFKKTPHMPPPLPINIKEQMQQLLVPLIIDKELNEPCYLMTNIFEPCAVADPDPYKAKRQFITQLTNIINEPAYANSFKQSVTLLRFNPHSDYDLVVYYDFRKDTPVTAFELWHDILLNMEQLATDNMAVTELAPLIQFAKQIIYLFTK